MLHLNYLKLYISTLLGLTISDSLLWILPVQMHSTQPGQAQAHGETNQNRSPADLDRTDFIRAMDAEYRKRDINGDGTLYRSEIEQFELRVATAKARAENEKLFIRLDLDRNGSLSFNEFAAMVQIPTFVDVSPFMKRFDENKDQQVSLIEYRSATLKNFDLLDKNKDGVVSVDEANETPANSNPVNR